MDLPVFRDTGKLPSKELNLRQVEALKLFLAKHAVTQAQFDKSYRDLTEKTRISSDAQKGA